MPSPSNIWLRIEPYARSVGLEGGLHAAIHDPLWLLGRQWQLGEFQFEDAGSPVHAALEMSCAPVTRFLPLRDEIKKGKSLEFSGKLIETGEAGLTARPPLETLIEREVIRVNDPSQPRVRLAAEAGLQFLRLLGPKMETENLRSIVLKGFPLSYPTEEKAQLLLNHHTCNFLRVMKNRAPDGQLIYETLAHGKYPESWNNLSNEDRAIFDKAANKVKDSWLKWYETLNSEPRKDEKSSWIPERLEYEAAVAAPTSEGEVVLTASEYTDGHLDWYSFNVLPGASLGAKRTDLNDLEKNNQNLSRTAIPTPINYRGMPASRYWEFEDARIDFGAMTAGQQQLAKLLLIEFALVAGDDWFIIPVMAPVGTICHTKTLKVKDTFGREEEVKPASEDNEKWGLFRLSLDQRSPNKNSQSFSNMLFLPPTLGASLHGPVLDEVLFLRDEMANMAWAVERLVENPLGQTINRSETYFRSREAKTISTGVTETNGTEKQLFVYHPFSEVPEHWIALQPIRTGVHNASIKFERHGKWLGRILEPRLDAEGKPVSIYEEEIPREGVRVIRTFQYTRWIDGKTYLWIGRRKGVGRGEGSNGLQFDVLKLAKKLDT